MRELGSTHEPIAATRGWCQEWGCTHPSTPVGMHPTTLSSCTLHEVQQFLDEGKQCQSQPMAPSPPGLEKRLFVEGVFSKYQFPNFNQLPREDVAAPSTLKGSRQCWMGLGANWAVGKSPCLWQGVATDNF